MKTGEELRVEAKAIRAINEYHLVKSGAASYDTLGYGVPDEGPSCTKLYEFILIDSIVKQAERDLARQQQKSR